MCHFKQISDELKSQKPTRGLPTYQAGEHTCILKEEIPFLSCKRVKLSATWRPNGETFNFDRQIFGQKTAFLQHGPGGDRSKVVHNGIRLVGLANSPNESK